MFASSMAGTSRQSPRLIFQPSRLQWDAVSGATSYNVVWGTSSGTYTGSQSVGNVTRFNLADIAGLAQNTTYFMAVRAVNASGQGAASNELQIRNARQVA